MKPLPHVPDTGAEILTVISTDKDPRLSNVKIFCSCQFHGHQYIPALVWAEEQFEAGRWVSFYIPSGECIAEYPLTTKLKRSQ